MVGSAASSGWGTVDSFSWVVHSTPLRSLLRLGLCWSLKNPWSKKKSSSALSHHRRHLRGDDDVEGSSASSGSSTSSPERLFSCSNESGWGGGLCCGRSPLGSWWGLSDGFRPKRGCTVGTHSLQSLSLQAETRHHPNVKTPSIQ